MGDRSERHANSVSNDRFFTSFKFLSLMDNEKICNINNESGGSAYSSSSSFVSNDSSTKFITQQNTSFVDGENYKSEVTLFNHKYPEVPALVDRVVNFDFSKYEISSKRDHSDIVSLAKTHQGSQYLQLLLQKGHVNAITLLKAVYDSLIDVMTDRYGYSVINKIVDYLDPYQLAAIIFKTRPIFVDVACSEYGSYAIQKLIMLVKNLPVLPCVITSALSSDYFQLMTSRKGRYTLELCLTLFHTSDVEVLYEDAINECVRLAKDPQGCISLNLCIDLIPSLYQARLLFSVTENSACLSFDPSGTFVVQHVLRLCDRVINNEISRKLKGTYTMLSRMQHGSHLVQKCLEFSSLGIFYFSKELMQGEYELQKLVQDQFGNYVIQTALTVSQDKSPMIHSYLKNNLRKLEPLIRKTKYGLHVFKMLDGLPNF